MNQKVCIDYFETADRAMARAKKDFEQNNIDDHTAMQLQHAAECYLCSMIEAATKSETIFDLYRKHNAEAARKRGKNILAEDINKPEIPHRLSALWKVLKTEDAISKKVLQKIKAEKGLDPREVDDIFYTYQYFRFPKDPFNTWMTTHHISDIMDGWDTLKALRDVAKEFLCEYEMLMRPKEDDDELDDDLGEIDD